MNATSWGCGELRSSPQRILCRCEEAWRFILCCLKSSCTMYACCMHADVCVAISSDLNDWLLAVWQGQAPFVLGNELPNRCMRQKNRELVVSAAPSSPMRPHNCPVISHEQLPPSASFCLKTSVRIEAGSSCHYDSHMTTCNARCIANCSAVKASVRLLQRLAALRSKHLNSGSCGVRTSSQCRTWNRAGPAAAASCACAAIPRSAYSYSSQRAAGISSLSHPNDMN